MWGFIGGSVFDRLVEFLFPLLCPPLVVLARDETGEIVTKPEYLIMPGIVRIMDDGDGLLYVFWHPDHADLSQRWIQKCFPHKA